ncbi:MAG: Omp28-related outer membrane protein [Flavobacterium sp.]|uniref:Omp28-related outer membrane protein n=1 Tax=Flavobacterium sp. TaxID=239 RepID=UPI00379532AD
MKKILLAIAFLSTLIYTSCSSDESGNGGSSYTSITLSSSTTDADLNELAVFTTTANNGTLITSNITYYVNDVAITGNTYTFTSSGTYNVYSKYVKGSTTLTSATIEIAVYDKISFNKRVLIEDFTGTWCGYCPRVAYAIDQVNNQTTDATVVAIHRGSDPYNFTGASSLESQIGLTGYPTAMLNRTTDWSYPEPSYVSQAVNLTTGTNPYVGLALVTSTSGNTSTVEVKAKFGKNFSDLKLVVYALEDNLIYNQTNYTAYYGGTSTIANFEHNHVLRAVLSSDILGETVTGSTNLNDEFSKTFTYSIPSNVNASNVHFVAFIVDSSKKALNSRAAGANENQSFEIE